MSVHRVIPRHLSAVAAVAVLTGLSLVAAPVAAQAASSVQAQQSTMVSAVPASYTPAINDGVVYAIGQSGSTVVVGGSFDSVTPHGGSPMSVQYLTAFTDGTGAIISGFSPTVNGTVEAIAPGPTAGTVYVGGDFSTIDGVNTKMALISTSTGAIVSGWHSPSFNGVVNTIVSSGGQVFAGGYFTTVGGQSRVGLVALNSTTGAVNSYSVPSFTGHHNYGRLCNPATTSCAEAGTGIKSMDISPDGTRMIAIGNFVNVSGTTHDQAALIDLGSTGATVDPNWTTDAYTSECYGSSFDTYMRGVQFSPDGSYFVIVTTGGGFGSVNSDGTDNSCDSAARFETTGTGSDVQPTWLDATGNDTFLSVAITGTAVYVGGHQRWTNNPNGDDRAGEGAVPRPGLVALDPVNGMPLSWNPGRNPRGAGAYAVLATSDGLYVGSDTDYIGNHQYYRPELAFFPLAGGETLASNKAGSLPGTVYLLGSGTSSSTARSVTWDGVSAPGTPQVLNSVNWSTARGAFEINNEVYYGSTDGNFYERSFDGTNFGAAVAIDPYDDPTWDNVQTGSGQTYRGLKSTFYNEMSSLTSMFYWNGRVYYTLSNNSHMYWRYFEPDSGVMGAIEYQTTDSNNWSHVSGAFLSGSTLYEADSASKHLFSVPFSNGEPSGTLQLANSAIDWTSHGAFVSNAPANQPPVASFTSSCSGLTCSFNASGSQDPDGTIVSYQWNWGDGTSKTDTTPTDSHTYATTNPNGYQVTLTVTDNDGATNSITHTVNPSATPPPAISYSGGSAVDGTGTSLTTQLPASVQAGDQLLMFVSYASPTATVTPPSGWTLVGSKNSTNNNLETDVYQRTAQASDASSNVTATFSASVKASMAVADYANAVSVETTASAKDASTASHTTPTVTGLTTGSLAVSYWTDKSTGTTSWAAPAGVTTRSTAFGSGGGAVSELLADSGSAVSGSYGGLTATTNATSGAGVEWTVALANS